MVAHAETDAATLRQPGAVALTDLGEEPAADPAESFEALAVAQGQLMLAGLGSPRPVDTADLDEGSVLAVRQEWGSGMART